MPLLLLLLVSLFNSGLESKTWQCRNDLEITCSADKCESETADSFTPMSVQFSENGQMNVCAYSGCWEGLGNVYINGDFLVVSGLNMNFSTAPKSESSNENILISLDKRDNVANIKAGAFAQPLVCELKKN